MLITPREFSEKIEKLGSLHDSTLDCINIDFKSSTILILIRDVMASFEGMEEYTNVSWEICIDGVRAFSGNIHNELCNWIIAAGVKVTDDCSSFDLVFNDGSIVSFEFKLVHLTEAIVD